ncbi:hypothetical protein [Flavobacterium indicum]|nr:hypothetical protein [Flavobacterium indicum]
MISLEDKITVATLVRFIEAFIVPDNWQVYSTTKKQTSLKSA